MIDINDSIVLIDDSGKKYRFRVRRGMHSIKNLVIDSARLVGLKEGVSLSIGEKKFKILKPSIEDLYHTLERKAQIVVQKDSAMIISYASISSGDVILEIGTGSGALTMVLAYMVKPTGKVITFEKREDFANIARKNIESACLEKYVDFRLCDVRDSKLDCEADSVIIDIPEPWTVVDHVYKPLKIGGYIATCLPTMNQVERITRELKSFNFAGIKTFEVIQREIVVHDDGVRPASKMLGHTVYLTFARKI
jgi:tRNA (adenine57-N1/adenine58-N1)-methyltransferase